MDIVKKIIFTLKYHIRLTFKLLGIPPLGFTAKPLVQNGEKNALRIIEEGYFYKPGLNVLVYKNTFPKGHQDGVVIFQYGTGVTKKYL